MKSGWDIKKLGEVCELIADGDWIESKDQSTCGIRLVQTGNVGVGIFRNKEGSEHFVSSETFRRLNCTEIFGGDILISRLPDPVGRACVVPDLGQKMITAVDCSIVRLRRSVCLPTFLVYYASSAEWFNAIEAKCTGSTRKRISRKNLTDVLVPIPPLAEQKRIVAKIDAAFEKIDKLKANAEKNLANAKELFQSALDEAMRPKDGWVEKRLGEVAEIQRGGSPRPIKDFITQNKDGYNWIKIGDVDPSGKFITSTAEKIRKEGLRKTRQVFAGEFLLSNSMSFGRPYILKIDGCIHDGWLVLRGFQKFYKEDFFYHLLRSKWIQNQFNSLAYGSTVRNLNSNSVSNVIVPIVALEEQQEIADSLDRLQSQTGVLQQNYTKQIADCEEMRQAVLREAFEGRL